MSHRLNMLNMLNMLNQIVLSISLLILFFGERMQAIRNINMIFTRHAVRRVHERGFSLSGLIEYLKRNTFTLLEKNREGYEICVPMKGRLVGKFDDNHNFIVKSFLYPIKGQTTKQYPKYLEVKISKIDFFKMEDARKTCWN